ncbi:MAG TPA: NAD(P)-binding domain-containing protein [Allocoleopsis sp.]
MTTGIAIIGAGRWGVNLIRNFLKHPDAQIITVVDVHPENLQSLSQKMGNLWDENIILTTDYNRPQATLQ